MFASGIESILDELRRENEARRALFAELTQSEY